MIDAVGQRTLSDATPRYIDRHQSTVCAVVYSLTAYPGTLPGAAQTAAHSQRSGAAPQQTEERDNGVGAPVRLPTGVSLPQLIYAAAHCHVCLLIFFWNSEVR